MSSTLSKISKLALFTVLGAIALGAPASAPQCDDGIQKVVAGDGLTGGGTSRTVRLDLQDGGITKRMLSQSAIDALSGKQGPAGPQGPAGTGGAVVRKVLQQSDFGVSTFDTSSFGVPGQDANGAPIDVVPSLRKTISFTLTKAGVIQSRDFSFANGPQDANGFTFTNFATLLELFDAQMNRVAYTSGTLGQDDNGALLANGVLRLPAGSYKIRLSYIALSTLRFDNSTFNYQPLPPDATLITPHAVIEVLPEVG
jgi:hypothetical protein